MSKRQSDKTFAEMVTEESARDHSVVAPRSGARPYPSWRDVTIIQDGVDAIRAKEMVQDGAEVGWDDCGSRGFAGEITWLDSDFRWRLAESNPPELQYGGNILEVELPDGRRALVAELPFKWGSVF